MTLERSTACTPEAAAALNRRLDRRRAGARTSSVGGRYLSGLHAIAPIRRFVSAQPFWARAAALLGSPIHELGVLSLAALDILPGDPGLGEHFDYPHSGERPDAPHMSAQFILSLDGTDAERAPLWIGDPENIVCMQPGELLFFGGNVRHGVHPNKSERPRTTVLWSMGPYWVRPMLKELWDWDGFRGPRR